DWFCQRRLASLEGGELCTALRAEQHLSRTPPPERAGGTKAWRQKANEAQHHGQEVRQQGCLRARLHCLNSSPPGSCLSLGKDAETRKLAVVGSFEESDELPGTTVTQ